MKKQPIVEGPTHAARFDALLTGLLAVSKTEVLRREAEYKKQRAGKKRAK